MSSSEADDEATADEAEADDTAPDDTEADDTEPDDEELSGAELEEVLPAVIEEHGIELVRLMLASYAISDAPVRPVMRELLETDERFALPDAPADDDETADDLPSFGLVARTAKSDDPERAEVLEKRKANKAERRE